MSSTKVFTLNVLRVFSPFCKPLIICKAKELDVILPTSQKPRQLPGNLIAFYDFQAAKLSRFGATHRATNKHKNLAPFFLKVEQV